MRCSAPGCNNQARMAVTTKRPTRENMWSKVWYDDRTAPKTAQRYCRTHGSELISQLAEVLVDVDELEEEL